MKIVIMCTLLCLLCSCATLMEQLDKQIPDGETCLMLETTTKRVEFCVSKKTTYKNTWDLTKENK